MALPAATPTAGGDAAETKPHFKKRQAVHKLQQTNREQTNQVLLNTEAQSGMSCKHCCHMWPPAAYGGQAP